MTSVIRAKDIAERKAEETWKETQSYEEFSHTWQEVFRKVLQEIHHNPTLKGESVFEILGVKTS